MKPTRRRFVTTALALGLAAAGAPPARAAEPQRVASLNLSADEVLVDILPPARLVGVTRFADSAEDSNVAGRVPATAIRFAKADLERLVALRADLVVVSEYTDADFLTLLERTGVRHHRMRGLGSLPGIRAALLTLGDAVGEREGAQRMVAEYDRKLRALAQALAGAERPRVLYWSQGVTAGANTTLSALIEAAGGRCVGAELGLEGIVPLGAERAFVSDPDVVLLGNWPGAAESLAADPLLSQLRAVREGRAITLPNRLLVAVSHYTADAAWALAHRLHPARVSSPEAPR